MLNVFTDFMKGSEDNIALTTFSVKGYNNNLISTLSHAGVSVRNGRAHGLNRVEFGLAILRGKKLFGGFLYFVGLVLVLMLQVEVKLMHCSDLPGLVAHPVQDTLTETSHSLSGNITGKGADVLGTAPCCSKPVVPLW